MTFKYTKNYIFKRLSDRVKNQFKKKRTSIYKDFYSDESMLYKVIKCEINKRRNPYLINDHIIKILIDDEIFNTKKQLLWGNDIVDKKVLFTFFNMILNDMLDNEKYHKFLDKILIGYAEYSLYRTLLIDITNPILRNVITNNLNLNEQELLDKYMTAKINAIKYLYFYTDVSKKFEILFLNFIDKIDSFRKLDTKIDNILLKNNFKSLLSRYEAKEDSLGYRVESIIKNDIKVIAFDNILPKKIEHPMRMLPEYSLEYINKLISIQKQMINNKDIIINQIRTYTKGSKKSDFI